MVNVSIILEEYMNLNEINTNASVMNIAETKTSSASSAILHGGVICEIEGLHGAENDFGQVVYKTKNFTRYMNSAIIESQKSWTYPYEKPMILHHNEKDGKIVGRIKSVEYKAKNTLSGTPALMFHVHIPDDDAAKQVKDRRLNTVSVGVSSDDVRCSICNQNVAVALCEHERGEAYGNDVCYWDVYHIEGKELSFVIVPSDVFAQVVSITDANRSNKAKGVNESMSLLGDILGKEIPQEKEITLQEGVNEHEESLQTEEGKKSTEEEKEVLVEEQEQEEVQDAQAQEEQPSEPEQESTEETKEDVQPEDEPSEDGITEDRIEKLESEVEELKRIVSEKEREAESKQMLVDELELQLAESKEALKKEQIVQINALRKTLGKQELSESALLSRSNESISDALVDLREEVTTIKPVKTIEKPVNSTVVTTTPKAITESASDYKREELNTIDLEEYAVNLFSRIF